MAALTNNARDEEHQKLGEEWSRRNTETDLLHSELRSLINVADDWIDTNGASFLTTLKAAVPGKAASVTKQIAAEVLVFVVQRRFLEDA